MKTLPIQIHAMSIAVVASIIIVGTGWFGIQKMHDGANDIAVIYNDLAVPIKQLKIISDMYAVNVIDAHNKADAGIIDVNKAIAEIERAQLQINAQWQAYQNTKIDSEEQIEIDKLVPLFKAANVGVSNLIVVLKKGNKKEISAITEANYATIDLVTEKINVLIDLQLNVAKTKYDQSVINFDSFVKTIILCSALGVLASLIYAAFFARNISILLGGEPTKAREVLETIANGDLSQDIQVAITDKTSLFSATQKMQTNLRHLIAQIQLSAESINNGAQEISAGNTNLSQRTEEQASSLEETASSMEQMASTVKQNAENAKQANVMANEASEVAVKGKKAVGQVMFTMNEINTSSKKIVDIISVIDGIAFQTNILALNAAVEAARAGEQGRGFAVVAAEVRSLAQRSAIAAKEIKQLINTSVDNVTSGTKLVEDAGETMEDIVMAVKMVTDIVNEIAAASLEQSAGIDQVNNAITNMDEVTQQNAALVEEAAAAAVSLQHLAIELTEATSQFTLGTDADYRDANYAEHDTQALNKMANLQINQLPKTKQTRLKAPKTKASEDWEEF